MRFIDIPTAFEKRHYVGKSHHRSRGQASAGDEVVPWFDGVVLIVPVTLESTKKIFRRAT